MKELIMILAPFVMLFLIIFILLCYFAPFIAYPILGLFLLYIVLSTIFPGLIHGKTVYRGTIYVLRDDFRFFKGHTKRWNLKETFNYQSIEPDIYFQQTWNPFYGIELASGKTLRLSNSGQDFWLNKTFFVKPHTTIEDFELIQEYFNTEGRDSFGEYITNLQKKAELTYKEAKKNPYVTREQKIQQVIRDYHKRIHKKGEK